MLFSFIRKNELKTSLKGVHLECISQFRAWGAFMERAVTPSNHGPDSAPSKSIQAGFLLGPSVPQLEHTHRGTARRRLLWFHQTAQTMVSVWDQGVWSDFLGMAQVTFPRDFQMVVFGTSIHFPYRDLWLHASHQRVRNISWLCTSIPRGFGGCIYIFCLQWQVIKALRPEWSSFSAVRALGPGKWETTPLPQGVPGPLERQKWVMPPSSPAS